MPSRRILVLALCSLSGLSLATLCAPGVQVVVPGLSAPVKVNYDLKGVPHVIAANDLDLRARAGLRARARSLLPDGP